MAATERVRGVQFNYVNFLWKEIAWIKEMEKQGQYQEGLQSLIDLLHTLPKNVFDKFTDPVSVIHKDIAFLRFKVRDVALDWFNRIVLEKKVIQKYARMALTSLLREVCNELDKRGYMEKVSPDVEEGYSHTLDRRRS